MKGKILGLILILVMVTGLILYIHPELLINSSQCTTKVDTNNNLFIPLFGFYSCEPAIGGTTTSTITIPQNLYVWATQYTRITCNVNAPNCQINNPVPPTFSMVCWCPVGTTGCTTLTALCTDSTAMNINLNNGQWVDIIQPFTGSATVQNTYTIYTLWQTSPSGGKTQVYDATHATCTPPGGSELCTGDITNQYCTKGVWNGALNFNEITNYLDKWVIGPTLGNIYTYNGQQVFCSSTGTLQSIGQISTTNGCYNVPNQNIGQVACCPGAISGNLKCGSDFSWHAEPTQTNQTEPYSGTQPGTGVAGCISDSQCNGQGNYIVNTNDLNRQTAVKYLCVSGQCTLTSIVKSDCADSNACPTGTVCMLDPSTGKGTCVTPQGSVLPPRVSGYVCPDGSVVNDTSQCNLGPCAPWVIIPKSAVFSGWTVTNYWCELNIFISSVFNIIILTLTFIGFIVGLSLGRKWFVRSRKKTDKAGWLLALGLGIGVGVITYLTWWVGIIAIIIYAILRWAGFLSLSDYRKSRK